MKFEIKKFEFMSKEIEQIVKIDEDGTVWTVPNDPANSDYQAYLAFLAEEDTETEPDTV